MSAFPVLDRLDEDYLDRVAAEDPPYASAYSASEAFVRDATAEELERLSGELDQLSSLPDEDARHEALPMQMYGVTQEAGALDEFLDALRDRCRGRLRGDDSRPLIDPPKLDDAPLPHVLPALTEEQEIVVHREVERQHQPALEAYERRGQGITPVLRVDVSHLGLEAFEQATGRAVPATVGCVVVHDRRFLRQELPGVRLVSTWVQPERPPAPDLPALELLFSAYFRPTWHRQLHGRFHMPIVHFDLDQSVRLVVQAREELEVLEGLADRAARRDAIFRLGSHLDTSRGRQVDLLLYALDTYLRAHVRFPNTPPERRHP